ncbi:MAG: hypothetical protein QW818_00280 [Candidatus Aenigmatarchaeota archaeon]|nr:hypothetical protein [Candidatus Aenigmarchaeota archaeon]
MSDIENEIERLKMKKIEITHKLNMTEFVDEKEEYMKDLEKIQKQIDILERMR